MAWDKEKAGRGQEGAQQAAHPLAQLCFHPRERSRDGMWVQGTGTNGGGTRACQANHSTTILQMQDGRLLTWTRTAWGARVTPSSITSRTAALSSSASGDCLPSALGASAVGRGSGQLAG